MAPINVFMHPMPKSWSNLCCRLKVLSTLKNTITLIADGYSKLFSSKLKREQGFWQQQYKWYQEQYFEVQKTVNNLGLHNSFIISSAKLVTFKCISYRRLLDAFCNPLDQDHSKGDFPQKIQFRVSVLFISSRLVAKIPRKFKITFH